MPRLSVYIFLKETDCPSPNAPESHHTRDFACLFSSISTPITARGDEEYNVPRLCKEKHFLLPFDINLKKYLPYLSRLNIIFHRLIFKYYLP